MTPEHMKLFAQRKELLENFEFTEQQVPLDAVLRDILRIQIKQVTARLMELYDKEHPPVNALGEKNLLQIVVSKNHNSTWRFDFYSGLTNQMLMPGKGFVRKEEMEGFIKKLKLNMLSAPVINAAVQGK